jgi:tetratricopeptide (TPR) repeat protein
MSKKRGQKEQRRRQKKQEKRKREALRPAGPPRNEGRLPTVAGRHASGLGQSAPAGGGLWSSLLTQFGGIRVGQPLSLPPDFPKIPAEILVYGEQQRTRLSPAERPAAITRHYEAGQRAFAREQYQQAISEFQRTIVLMTEDMAGPQVFFNLAQSYANLNQIEEFRAVMNFYLRIAPDDPDAYLSLAYNALLEEDYEECIRLSKLGRAHVRDRDPKGLINLGRAYQHLGRYQESISTLEEAISLNPAWSDAYHGLGACYENQLDLERAKMYYRRAVEVEPTNHAAQRSLERLEQGIVFLGPPPPWMSADSEEEE